MSQMSSRRGSTGSHGQGPGGAGIAVVAVIGAFLFFGWQGVLAFGAWAIGSVLWGAATMAVSTAVGAWGGLMLAGPALVELARGLAAYPLELLAYPGVGPLVLGALTGAAIAWLRMAMRVKERYDPLTSAVFSTAPAYKGGFDFFALLAANIVAGYLVMVAFVAVELIVDGSGASLDLVDAITVVTTAAGGGGGPFGGGDSLFGAFFFVLAALVVVGAVVGAIAGGGFGSIYGVGLWAFDPGHMIFGASQGATVHWLTKRRQAKGAPALLWHVMSGAALGAIEGALVGLVAGAILGAGHVGGH